jgi:hypothetical protein
MYRLVRYSAVETMSIAVSVSAVIKGLGNEV